MKPFKCDKCSIEFDKPDEVLVHIAQAHSSHIPLEEKAKWFEEPTAPEAYYG